MEKGSSMELILTPNCNLLYLDSNGMKFEKCLLKIFFFFF